MDEAHCDGAARMRSLLSSRQATPLRFRAALTNVPPADRDAWLDQVFGIDEVPADGDDLPPGCAPYLPCSVETLLQMVEHADLHAADVFVDIGSGLGRAAALTHYLTGAAAIGIEIQAGVPRPSCSWLTPAWSPSGGLAVYRSTYPTVSAAGLPSTR